MSLFLTGARTCVLFSVFVFLMSTTPVVHPSFADEARSEAPKNEVVLRGDTNKLPPDLQDVGVNEHLSRPIDLNLTFTNSADGKQYPLKDFFKNGKPVLLNLVYYECPMLCTMVLNGVVAGLKGLDWSIGNQFNMITISINPKDDQELAEQKRDAYVNSYIKPVEGGTTKIERDEKVARDGWHFFTGEESQIKTLADQLGFSYTYDKIEKQYGHPAVTFILTPDGKISRYLYGITYRPRDVRFALLEAAQGKIGTVFDRLLMFCYHYEPTSRGYALHAVKVMKAGGAGTVALLAGYLTVFWTRQRKRKGQHQ